MSTHRQPDDAAGREWNDPADGPRWAEGRGAGGSRVAADEADQSGRRADEHLGRPASEVSPEGRLRAVLAAMADAVLVYDMDGRIVDANGALAAILGLDAEPTFAELPMTERGRRTLPRTLDGRPLAPDEWLAARILAGEELTDERAVDMVFTVPDGREVCVNATGGPLRDVEGRTIGAVVALRDVTERRRLERELAARGAELESIFEAMGDGVMVVDGQGRIVRTNGAWRETLRRCADLLGLDTDPAFAALSLDEQKRHLVIRDEHGRVLQPEEWPAARALRGEMLTGQDAVDELFLGPDGRELRLSASAAPIWDAAGRPSGAVGVLRDVTERRRLERELAARGAELESIFATQAEGVVFADASGCVLRMNDAQRRLLVSRGVDPAAGYVDAWVRQAPLSNVAGRPVPREELPFYQALRGETLVGERAVELRQRGADGHEQALRISAAPMRDEQGHIVGVVLTSDDVSEQRRLEMQRVDVMRVVAHDLANPVAAVQLYVQTQRRRLKEGQQPFTPDDALLDSMEQALARVQRLLDDLKVATSLETGGFSLRRGRFDLAALCRREAAAQRSSAGREVRVETPPAPVWAEVDGERVGQVLANLLTNALKYSPEGRPVAVELTLLGGGSDGGAGVARVRVRDEGPGIPESERGRLFEQFHRVPGVEALDGSTGLGLGLYISKNIIARHGGAIGVESEAGRGSVFWFTLPLGPVTG